MYLNHYGLKDEPFRLTPDPRYLHLSAAYQTALTTVLEGILYRKGLVMVTGPIGTGKTTLVHTALQMLTDVAKQNMFIRSALLFNPTLTRDEFLEMMLDDFEVSCPSTSKPKRLAALHQMLLDTQRRGGTAVLFIDEAHLLSSELLEEIRLLGNADTHHEKLLQIVLSGQPELVGIMERPELSALRQRIAGRANLRPLGPSELSAYVAERLRFAGLTGTSPFTQQSLDEVLLYSTGVPRLVNLVCDASLSLGHKFQVDTIGPDIVVEAATELGLVSADTTRRKTERVLNLPTVSTPARPTSIVDTLIESMKQNRGVELR
ncbi:MAG TPA: AAA family ATPase [Dongiaceae bacterium]|nr:AAA family ATPase [Dongiaceae bacterium]